MGVLS
jgi:aryl-alcohol dehydrogenase-like predicted oxidoreductase